MRKIKLIITSILFSTIAYAQKGSFYVGGQVGYSTLENKYENNVNQERSNWSFSPEFGTFLNNNIQLGIGLNLSGGNNEQMYGTSEKINQKFSSFGGTVYSRYFFGEGTKSFRPFVGINLGASSGYEERINFYNNGITSTTSISKYDISSFGANFNAGFAYSLSPKVTMVGSLGVLGFENRTFKNKENSTKETSNSFGFDINSLGNRFNIGVYLTL